MRRLDQRRSSAAQLFHETMDDSYVARRLRVHRTTVLRWRRLFEREGGGRNKLRTKKPGPKPKLSARELWSLERTLLEGPRRHGFETDKWTLPAATIVIQRMTGVDYHPRYVWHIIADRLPPAVRRRFRRRQKERSIESITREPRSDLPHHLDVIPPLVD